MIDLYCHNISTTSIDAHGLTVVDLSGFQVCRPRFSYVLFYTHVMIIVVMLILALFYIVYRHVHNGRVYYDSAYKKEVALSPNNV